MSESAGLWGTLIALATLRRNATPSFACTDLDRIASIAAEMDKVVMVFKGQFGWEQL